MLVPLAASNFHVRAAAGVDCRAPMLRCGPGSVRTGSAWTTWTGCAGRKASSARDGVLGWRLKDARWKCAGCDRKVSATAGTIFDKTRTR